VCPQNSDPGCDIMSGPLSIVRVERFRQDPRCPGSAYIGEMTELASIADCHARPFVSATAASQSLRRLGDFLQLSLKRDASEGPRYRGRPNATDRRRPALSSSRYS